MNSTAAALRAKLVAQLEESGRLRDPRLRQAVLDAPREIFVPEFYRQTSGAWETITNSSPGYLETVYADQALTTQLIDGDATSSSSQPSLMVDMVEALDFHDGQVIEIATGSGYNAWWLAAIAGAKNVVTVEVDGGLVDLARKRLRDAGAPVTVVHGDGRLGFPDRAPYDRLICTVNMWSIPAAWLSQVRPGGIIVTPLGWGNVRMVVSQHGDAMGAFLSGGSYFMGGRQEGSAGSAPYPGKPEVLSRRPSVIEPAAFWGEDEFRFLLSLVLPNVGAASEQDGDQIAAAQLWAADGSWARVEGGEVAQGGPRRLWDVVERAQAYFEANGRPTRERFGVTASADGHHFWLDEPSRVLRLP